MMLKDKIIQYIDAGYPILYIHSFEEIKIDRIIKCAVGERQILEWNYADGICDFKTKRTDNYNRSFEDTLQNFSFDDELDKKILVIKDILPYFQEPSIISYLKKICHKIENGLDTAIIIVAPIIKIPKELEKFITILEMNELTEEEINKQIQTFAQEQDEIISPMLLKKMSLAFKGLSEFEIENLLALCIATEGSFSDNSLKLILEQKRQMILKSDILEMIPVKEKMNDIGGLEDLKSWLIQKSKIYKSINKAQEYGVDMPKGVLIVGAPGCGKSLCAKVTSAIFEVPLLKLDIGKIMGKYAEESETNMKNAIKLAESISPCVLWVDEFEKANDEVNMRLFRNFLKWMQKKSSPVFVVVTANDISGLPSELFHKGQFDDIYYVDLPNEKERKKIFEIHISKRRSNDLKNIDIDTLIKSTDGYSGADIEGVVAEAVEIAFIQDMENKTVTGLKTEHISKCIERTKSISVLMKDSLEILRKFFKDNHFKNASL